MRSLRGHRKEALVSPGPKCQNIRPRLNLEGLSVLLQLKILLQGTFQQPHRNVLGRRQLQRCAAKVVGRNLSGQDFVLENLKSSRDGFFLLCPVGQAGNARHMDFQRTFFRFCRKNEKSKNSSHGAAQQSPPNRFPSGTPPSNAKHWSATPFPLPY